jgi:hypothetical protein
MLNKKFIYFLFILFFSQELTGQSKAEITRNTIIETIPFVLTSHNNISIEAVLGGVDTLRLMFHTAASSLTLTTEATSRLKSIRWDEERSVGAWGGSATSRLSRNNLLKIGKLQWDSLAVWEDERSGPSTDGKFGPNLFNGYIIEIDFDNKVLMLHEALPDKSKQYLKMNLYSEEGSLFINGISTIAGVDYENKFLIHSGYGGSLLFDDQFVLGNNIGEKITITDVKELKDSFGNIVKVKKGLLPSFKLGDIELTEVPVGFFQGKIGEQQMSIIGGDLLKRFNIMIDENRKYIYLNSNELAKITYTDF